jgi:transcription elongation factor/antiterminator RfaH
MNRWHLVYTKPRQEETAFINLTNQNYESYLPFISKEKILQGKKVVIKEPMFPRYIFVRLNNDGSQNWSPIRSTKGVSHPIILPSQVTAGIQEAHIFIGHVICGVVEAQLGLA